MTLTKDDPEFAGYLAGTFSSELRAIPVDSFNINSLRERVTFRLVPREQIRRPGLALAIIRAVRPEFLHLTFGPALATVAALVAHGALIDGVALATSMLALFCFHSAAFLFNDYNDHMQGIDRIQQRRGSQVIQRGWLTARQVSRVAMGFLLMGCLLGLPVIMAHTQALPLIGLVALLAVVGFSFRGRGLKYQGLGDVVVFLCMGPLLMDGVAQTVAGERSWWLGGLGVIFGLAAVLILQLRQLETIMAERQSRSGTLIARLGFDRAKRWIAWEMALLPILLVAVAPTFLGWAPAVTVTLLVFALCWLGILRLRRASSPLSSVLFGLARSSRWVHAVITALLVTFMLLNPWLVQLLGERWATPLGW